jgi:hypothetical protein
MQRRSLPPIGSDTARAHDGNPESTANVNVPPFPSRGTSQGSSTARRRTFSSALVICNELKAAGAVGFPEQSDRGDEGDCAICEERESTVLAKDGRLICEICDGDLARGLVT